MGQSKESVSGSSLVSCSNKNNVIKTQLGIKEQAFIEFTVQLSQKGRKVFVEVSRVQGKMSP